MDHAERYINEVMRLVLATREERERFATDLRAHFEEGLSRNQTVLEVIFKLGTPEAVAEAFNAERPFVYAGFWRRLAAFFGDMSLFVLAIVPGVAALFATEHGFLPRWLGLTLMALFGLAIFGLSLIYFPLLESRFGKTLGKHMMKIRVVGENGRPLLLRQAVIRRLSFYFDFVALDALFIPFTERKQRGLDIVAKTVVVNEPGETPALWAWVAGLFGWIAIIAVLVSLAQPYM